MSYPAGGLVKRSPSHIAQRNLSILQRKDGAVSEILATATYVVIYVFEANTKQWERKEIEGSLFVVKRSFGCRFRLVVLNRINPKNLEQDLTGSFTFEDMSPYLLYRTEGGDSGAPVETLAIWFHNEKEKGNMVNCLRKVLRLQASAAQLEEQQQQQQQSELKESLLAVDLPSQPLSGPMRPDTFGADVSSSSNGGTESADVSTSGGGALDGSISKSGAASTAPSKSMSIEELLLKAAIGGGKERKDTTPQSSPPLNASSPPAESSGIPRPSAVITSSPVMNMLLKPRTLQTPGGLLNPLGLRASQSGSWTPGGSEDKMNGSIRRGSDTTASSSSNTSTVFDKAQLKEALLSLIEDDSFLEMLHDKYLASCR